MAKLTAAQRRELGAEFMRKASREGRPINVSKATVFAAFGAADDFIDDNAPAFNNSLSAEARAGFTQAEKSEIFSMTSQKRFSGGGA